MQIREGRQTFQIEEKMKTPKLNLTLCFMSPDSCEEQMFNQRGTKKPKSQEKAFEQALHLLNNGLEKNY